MRRLLTLLLIFACGVVRGQGLAPAPSPDARMSPYAMEREQTIAPAMAAMQRADYANALAMFESVVPRYPHDARVLMFAGRAAHLAGNDAKALDFYKSALGAEPPNHPQWGLHVEIVPLYAAASDWPSFNSERTKIRDAVTTGDAYFAKFVGYTIETIHQGDKTIQVTEFPRLYGRFHTRYRFTYPVDPAMPNWRAYMDCESDDIDQVSFAKTHPEQAAKGERAFSLDAYMKPNTHGTMMLYGDGEPTYETVRARVLGNAAPLSTTTKN